MDYAIHMRRWERERKEGVCGAYNPEVVEYLLVVASYLKKVNSKDNNSKMEKIAVSNYGKPVVCWCFLLCDVCLPVR